MKKMSALFLSLAFASPAFASTWVVDQAHGEVGFGVKHMGVSTTKGKFNKFSGTVNLDDKDVTKSTVTVEIDPASIDTNNDKRDEHLKSKDFFDVATHKAITFKSTKVEKAANGLKVTGDLTLHGVTKPVTLDVEGPQPEVKDPWGGTHSAVKAVGKINRQDFGLTWANKTPGGEAIVSDDVMLTIEVELLKQEAAAPAAAKDAKDTKAPAKK